MQTSRDVGQPGILARYVSTPIVTAMVLLLVAHPFAAAEPRTLRFENLQVLPEDASAAEVFRVMKLMTRALATQCVACHRTAEREYGSDAVPAKITARAMMRLEHARRPQLDWRNPPDDLCMVCHQGAFRPPVLRGGN